MSFDKQNFKKVLLFLFIQLLFVPIFSFILVYYGPFENIKGFIVYTAMHTANHKYLATYFLSKEQIDEIVAKYKTVMEKTNQNIDDVKPLFYGDKGLDVTDVYVGLSRGKLMKIKDPSRIKLAVSDGLGRNGSTLSEMVFNNGATGGINGGAYINKDNVVRGGAPGGVIIINYKLEFLQTPKGRYCVIGFNSNHILVIDEVRGRKEIDALHINFGVSFGPALIINGQPLVKKSGAGLQPRTAIAQCKDGTVLFLVLDGRQVSSAGATLEDVQNVLLKNNAYNAANLDGGSSTAMVYNNKVINSPSESLREKYLPSAFLVMPAA